MADDLRDDVFTLLSLASQKEFSRNLSFDQSHLSLEYSNHVKPLLDSKRTLNTMSTTIAVEKKKLKKPPLDVYQLGDKMLRQTAKRVTKIDDELRDLVRKMLQTMYSEDGIGLAAPQVGIHKQILVIDIEFDKPEVEPLVLINPTVKKLCGKSVADQEGCLSVPGVFMDVTRPDEIEVTYKDEFGRLKTLTADGLLSRVIQHEIDHLNGVLFVDRIPNHLALTEELKKQGFSFKAIKPV